MTDEEFNEGMYISIMVGLYYTFNAFVPILAWYGWRRVDILAMDGNTFYKIAWYSLYALHFIVFTPMAFIWPMTYSGIAVVVEFYDLANWYLGSVAAGVVYSYVSLMWIFAAFFYSDTDSLNSGGVW